MVVNRNKIITQAQKLTAKGQLEKAVAEYKKLLKADANDIRTWLKVGDLYTRMGSRKEATETYLRVADKYTKNGFHLKAVAVYKQVLKLDPTQIEVFQLLADSYIHLGLTSEALIQLEQLADHYQRLNRSNRMLAVLAQMAEIDPKNIATRLRIAEHLSKENRTLEAVEQFRLTCEELRVQKRTEDFLKVAERLLYHDPSQIDIARETASLYLEQGMYKRALAKLQMCFVNEPRNLSTLEMLAKAFQSLGQPDKAVSVLKEMSTLLEEQGNAAWRQQVLETIVRLDPTNEMALKGLGRKRALSGQPARAATGAQRKPVARPNTFEPEGTTDISVSGSIKIDEQVQQLMSEVEVLMKYDLKSRAMGHLESILELDYFNINARETIKDILLDSGKVEEALDQLFILADMFRETQPEGSVYYLHEILKIDPSSERAKQMIIDIGGIMPEDLEKDQSSSERAVPAQTALEQEDEDAIADKAGEGKQGEDLPHEDQDSVLDDEELLGMADEALEKEILDEEEVEAEEEIIEEIDEEAEPEREFDEEEVEENLLDFVESAASESTRLKTGSLSVSFSRELAAFGAEATGESELDEQDLPEIQEELEEIEFYVEQGLTTEARVIVEDLKARFPSDPRVAEVAASLPIEEEDYGQSFDPRESRIKIEEEVEFTDFDTHYDLGIAYKEMGLYEDAMVEFESAALDPEREALCQTMIGLCLVCLNRIEDSIKIFKKGLNIEDINPQQRLGLLYELGKAYEQIGRRSQALDCFEQVRKQNPKFADVAVRITSLEGEGRS